MAYSREIIKKILQNVRFRIPTTEEKDSYYSEIGNTLIRVSNHCTRLRVWDYMLEKNPKWKGKPIISIVFEDGENTFDENDCLVLNRYRMKPIKVKEYVYNLQNNPQFITNADEGLIIKAIKGISNGQYTDLTNKCAEPVLRISQNPPDEPPNNQENKKLNCNRNMNKKLIRLTESDLHRIVKESVNRVLMREGFGDGRIENSLQKYLDKFMDSMVADKMFEGSEFPSSWYAMFDSDDENESGWFFKYEDGHTASITLNGDNGFNHEALSMFPSQYNVFKKCVNKARKMIQTAIDNA